jgi:GrpE
MPAKPTRWRGWLTRQPAPAGPPPAWPAGAPAAPPAAVVAAERAALVRTCIYVRDRVTSVALARRLDQGLAEVGVRLVEPTGERFDPSRHEAAGTRTTHNPALVGTVATVEAPGYADRGVLVRPPVVTVYQPAPGTDTDATGRLP